MPLHPSRRGLLLWRGNLFSRDTSSLRCNLLPTNLRHYRAALCMSARGSWGAGRVVSKYACASTSAASGVLGLMLFASSTAKKEDSRFHVRCCLSACPRFSTREPCLWYLPSLVCDALLRASLFALLVVLADSLCCPIISRSCRRRLF
jgi:hypothetical protein